MHIGHLRTTVIGDALVRMFSAVGHDVVRENHIGDWGRPFGMLIEHLVDSAPSGPASWRWATSTRSTRRPRPSSNTTRRSRSGPATGSCCCSSRDAETIELWQRLVAQSAEHWNEVYAKLGVLLTDDDLAGESRYEALMPEVLERLDAAGLLEESDGALVVFPPGFTNREGEPLPLIVRSRAGAFTYATSDLACVVDRVERVKATRLRVRRRTPQAQHLQMVFAVSRWRAGCVPPARCRARLVRSVLGDRSQAAAQPDG